MGGVHASNVCIKMSREDACRRHAAVAQLTPCPHSHATHNTHHTQCDACELALDVFKEMRADGVRPNVVTYNTLVDVYGKIGQWERAVGVLDDMGQDVSRGMGFHLQFAACAQISVWSQRGACGTAHVEQLQPAS